MFMPHISIDKTNWKEKITGKKESENTFLIFNKMVAEKLSFVIQTSQKRF